MIQIDEVVLKIAVGESFLHQFTVTDSNGDLVADAGLTLEIVSPDDSTATHSLGTVVTATTPTGTYNIDFITILVGDYFLTIKLTNGIWKTIYLPVGA